jgi:hypothetical protein
MYRAPEVAACAVQFRHCVAIGGGGRLVQGLGLYRVDRPFWPFLDRQRVSGLLRRQYSGLSGIIGLTTAQPVLGVWRDSYLWTFPQYLVGGIVATCFHLMIMSIGWAGMLFTFPVIYLVYRSYNIYLTRVDEQQKHIAEMAQLHLRTIEALALAIDAKGRHHRRPPAPRSGVCVGGGQGTGDLRSWTCRRLEAAAHCCTISANWRYRNTSSPSPGG